MFTTTCLNNSKRGGCEKERTPQLLCVQYHIWMEVTAVPYQRLHDKVHLNMGPFRMEADTFSLMRGERLCCLVCCCYGRTHTFFERFFKIFLVCKDYGELRSLEKRLHWAKIKSGHNSITCPSSTVLQDEWATAPRRWHIRHISILCKHPWKAQNGH